MLFNLQGPVAAFQVPGGLTVLRPAAPVNVDGVMVQDPPTKLTIKGFAHPMSGKELMLLPEGERTKEWQVVFALEAAPQPLQTADVLNGTLADMVLLNGRTFKVMTLEAWNAIAGYWRATCAKVGQ